MQVIYYAKVYNYTITMDLIGEFHPKSSTGNAYALTVICMLTGYTFCIPIKTKTAHEAVKVYIDNVYSKFGSSICILSDNRTEFRNQLFDNVAEQQGIQYKEYSPLHDPHSIERIEGFHHFLKSCIS